MLAPRLPVPDAAGDEAESPDVAERIETVAKTEPSFLPRSDYVRATQSGGMTVASSVTERACGGRGRVPTRHALGRLAVAGPKRRGPPARGARQDGHRAGGSRVRAAGGDARRLRDGHARPADAVAFPLLEALSCPTSTTIL